MGRGGGEAFSHCFCRVFEDYVGVVSKMRKLGMGLEGVQRL
jgi:hypothetical protein